MLSTLTLVGAYHPDGAPLDQRRVVVELTLRPNVGDLRRGRIPGRAVIEIEGLAERALGTSWTTLAWRRIDYRFTFESALRGRCELALSQRFERVTWRAATELCGSLSAAAPRLDGVVRLRVGWRIV